MSERARALTEDGRILFDSGDLLGAEAAFREAIDEDPAFAEASFDLGLVYKQQRDWSRSLQANLRAVELLEDLREEPACWNGGIAATALRDWAKARTLWRSFGISIPEGEGPVEMAAGIAPIRLDPDGNGEVVWATRIDPARARIDNIPTVQSGYRWHDIVLNDGAPAGERTFGDRTYSVFDALELWERSPIETLITDARCETPDDIEALEAVFGMAGWCAEDWKLSIRWMCRACSEGFTTSRGSGRPSAWLPWPLHQTLPSRSSATGARHPWVAPSQPPEAPSDDAEDQADPPRGIRRSR